MMIVAPVGPQRPNRAADVRTVQMLLNRAGGAEPLKVDGVFGPRTAAVIRRYQSQVLRLGQPDGVVDPYGPTIGSLHRSPGRRTTTPPTTVRTIRAAATAQAAASSASGGGNPGGLPDTQYLEIATRLECEIAAIKAVVQTEVAIRGAFDSAGRPTILFERHKFYYHTNGRFARSDPDICNADPGKYGVFSEQYPKLERAMKLDRPAALKSASWGAFQILGENHAQAGYSTVDAFVDAMKASLTAQVQAFVVFVRADRRLLVALRLRNWDNFARIYNGRDYRKNRYDEHMRTNYLRYTNQG